MAHGKKKNNEWWDRFDKWEKEWKLKRKEERLEDARKLRQAEDDYNSSLHSLNPLTTTPQPKRILATQSREPGVKRIPLESPLTCPIVMPAEIVRIDQPEMGEALILFRTDMINKGGDFLEQVAFQIKRIMEYLINERLLFILQPAGNGALIIQVAGDKKIPPFFNLSLCSPGAVLIKALEKSIQWSPGYIFNIQEILKGIVERLQKELKDQKED